MRSPLATLGAAVILGSISSAPSRAQTSASLPFGLIISEQARTSFTLRGAGARAAGMADTFTAVADDATAASYNPAGLAQLLVPEGSVVFSGHERTDDYTRFVSTDQVPPLTLGDSRATSRRADLNFASATVPFRIFGRRAAFQISTQQLVNLRYSGTRTFVENDQAGNPLNDLRQESDQTGEIRLWSASLAMKATDRLFLGVTLNRWMGDWTFASFNAEAPFGHPEQEEWFDYLQTNRLRGWNVDLGALLVHRYVNVGARYRAPFTADYRFAGSLDTNIPTPLVPAPMTDTNLDWPASWNVGIAIKPSDRLLVTGEWGRTDWSDLRFEVPGSGWLSFFDLAPRGTTHAGPVDDFRAGMEVLLFAGRAVVPLRAGWFREPEPSRDETTGERLVATGATFGAGLKIDWFAFDVAVRYRTAEAQVTRFLEPDEIARGALAATSRGRLRRRDVSVVAALIVQLPEGAAPTKLLREVFVGDPPRD